MKTDVLSLWGLSHNATEEEGTYPEAIPKLLHVLHVLHPAPTAAMCRDCVPTALLSEEGSAAGHID